MADPARESLACCTACGWAGLYPVEVDVGSLSAGRPAPANPCPQCPGGAARCALSPEEEREAIRQHLAAAFGDVRALPTEDGQLALVIGLGRGVPRAATVDVRALDGHPRLFLERIIAQLQTGAAAEQGRAPYR